MSRKITNYCQEAYDNSPQKRQNGKRGGKSVGGGEKIPKTHPDPPQGRGVKTPKTHP